VKIFTLAWPAWIDSAGDDHLAARVDDPARVRVGYDTGTGERRNFLALNGNIPRTRPVEHRHPITADQ
jgi:hypothetical protein